MDRVSQPGMGLVSRKVTILYFFLLHLKFSTLILLRLPDIAVLQLLSR